MGGGSLTYYNVDPTNSFSVTATSACYAGYYENGSYKSFYITPGATTYSTSGAITSVEGMFHNSGLNNIDLKNWDISNCTSLSTIFNGATDLETLDLTGWDTSHITSLYYTFYQCNKLTEIKGLYDLNFDNVVNGEKTFVNCNALTTLDLSNKSFSELENAQTFIAWCNNLKEVYLTNWTGEACTSIRGLLRNCPKLEYVDLSSFTPNEGLNVSEAFENTISTTLKIKCKRALKDLLISKYRIPYGHPMREEDSDQWILVD